MFITFEGIEGCGKTTQSRLLSEKLTKMGMDVFYSREPGGCVLSEDIRKILLNSCTSNITAKTELFLYLGARSQHFFEKIIPALNGKKIVIVDRFNDSTIAYQGYGRGLDISFITKACDFACNGTWPDITILLDVPVQEGLKRAMARNRDLLDMGIDEQRFEMEEKQFHEAVRQGYLELSKKFPKRIKVINGMGKKDEIFSKIFNLIRHKLPIIER